MDAYVLSHFSCIQLILCDPVEPARLLFHGILQVFSVNQVYLGTLRGAGNTKAAMIICLGCYVVFRQIYLFVSYRLGGGLLAVTLGYPAGWITCCAALLIYVHFGKNAMRSLVAEG